MSDPKLQAAAALMGQALGGISLAGDLAASFEVDVAEARVWAHVVVPSGDVYELSARWVEEASP